MRLRGLLYIGVTCALVAATATACTDPSLRIEPGWQDMSPCSSEPLTVRVEDLHLPENSTCNLVGNQVEFPDGTQLEVAEVGVNTGLSSGPTGDEEPAYTLVNLGVEGTLAVLASDQGVQIWGTPPAVERVFENPGNWILRFADS